MGTIFTLSPSIKAIVATALDDLITELGKQVRLVYPARWVSCSNCQYDQIGHKSSNYYKSGGPLPFPNATVCPMCNGNGKIEEENSEVVQMLCQWDPKDFYRPVPQVDIRLPFGSRIQTKGYLSDLPKILKADHAVFEIPIEPIVRYTYQLASEPADVSNIIQGRYVVADWYRITS